MLAAPGRRLAGDLDLALEDALDAAIECPVGRDAFRGFEEVVRLRSIGLAQELHQPDHGVVIERDVSVIFAARRRKYWGHPPFGYCALRM